MDIELTAHAEARLHQRGLSRPTLGYLPAYGRKVHDHHGSEIVCERLLQDSPGSASCLNEGLTSVNESADLGESVQAACLRSKNEFGGRR